MFDIASICRSFSDAASDYEEHARLQHRVRARALALARGYFSRQGLILDAGCGTGTAYADAQCLKQDWRWLGVDFSYLMCRQAHELYPSIITAASEQLPLPDACVDGVFSSLMLQWSISPCSVLAEMRRVLKPGGHAVIATLLPGTLGELRQAFRAVDGKPHISDFTPLTALLESAEKAGFSLALAQPKCEMEYYPDLIALMRSLQAIGATNQHQARKRGLTTPRQIVKLEQAYEPLRGAEGLPVSWQVLYLILRNG